MKKIIQILKVKLYGIPAQGPKITFPCGYHTVGKPVDDSKEWVRNFQQVSMDIYKKLH